MTSTVTSIEHTGRATPQGGRRADRAARATVLTLARRVNAGRLLITDSTGARHVRGHGTRTARLTVHDERAWSAVALRGSLGLGEAYARGWDSDDLTGTLRILLAALRPVTRALDRTGSTTCGNQA